MHAKVQEYEKAQSDFNRDERAYERERAKGPLVVKAPDASAKLRQEEARLKKEDAAL